MTMPPIPEPGIADLPILIGIALSLWSAIKITIWWENRKNSKMLQRYLKNRYSESEKMQNEL